MSTLYPFENIGRDGFGYMRARSDLDGVMYTVQQPYVDGGKWTANRTAIHLVQLLAGEFYNQGYKTMEEAFQACQDDFEKIDRVYQWIEHFRTSDPPPPAWKLRK